jgi:hypothetical protein
MKGGKKMPYEERNGERECFDSTPCDRSVCRAFDLSVPVTITPFAELQVPSATCVGEIEIHPGHRPCPGGKRHFEFTISQKIKTEIPVEFGAEVCFDEACIEDDGECEEEETP